MVAHAALPVEDTPASLGIEFEDHHHLNRFNRHKVHEIKSTKWACPHILNQLGLRNDFNILQQCWSAWLMFSRGRHLLLLDTRIPQHPEAHGEPLLKH
jgi:hypothetical protein